MTPEMALLMGKRLAKKHKVSTLWHLKVEPIDPGLYAYCDRKTFTLFVNEEYIHLGQRFVLEAWLHEIAHARCPSGDHGPLWHEKFENLMKFHNVEIGEL